MSWCSNDLKCVICCRRRHSSVAVEFPRKYECYSILRYKYLLLTTTHSLISTFYCSYNIRVFTVFFIYFTVQVLFTDMNIITVFTLLFLLQYNYGAQIEIEYNPHRPSMRTIVRQVETLGYWVIVRPYEGQREIINRGFTSQHVGAHVLLIYPHPVGLQWNKEEIAME